ncbi:hypothetical protein BZG36_00018 [Bifiguratus adelaidae]|uniref:FYVE-type domain-containing protein n=1 Tax=Bifiguratus adelaidae TaxID=1938954 RepID=A0A261Y8Q9_9FUNG|nr:hypothetical protein BZG36_00018 [Bifiguratus adelaidae]
MAGREDIPEFVTPPIPFVTHPYYGSAHFSSLKLKVPVSTEQETPIPVEEAVETVQVPEHAENEAPADATLTLHAAVQANDLTQVRELAQQASINASNAATGTTPLQLACSRGYLDIVKFLIEDCGAIVDLANKEGETPLHKACYFGHLAVAHYLLSKHANINQADKDGWTPLHNACSRGNEHVVALLLDNGAKVDEGNVMGYTPLISAASKGYQSIVELLLQHGSADPLLKDKFGESAYDAAAAAGWPHICEVLEEAEMNALTSTSEEIEPRYDPLEQHNTIPVILYENQRSQQSLLAQFSKPVFSTSHLLPSDTCGPWSSAATGRPMTKSEVQLPSLHRSRAEQSGPWFWLTDWQLDYIHPKADPRTGWSYAHAFTDPDEEWTPTDPATGNWVRRRGWVRVMKKRLDMGEHSYQEDRRHWTSGEYLERADELVRRASAHANLSGSDQEGNVVNARNRLKAYEDAIQILLGGLKADQDDERRQRATQQVSEYLQIAENLANMIANDDPGAQEPSEQPIELDTVMTGLRLAPNEMSDTAILSTSAPLPIPDPTASNFLGPRLHRAHSTVAASINPTTATMASLLKPALETGELEEMVGRGGASTGAQHATGDQEDNESVLQNTVLNLDHGDDDMQATGPTLHVMPEPSDPSSLPRQWESDDAASECRRCGRRFTFLNRRHHCRRCGLLVCDRCSSNRAVLAPSQVLHDPYTTPTYYYSTSFPEAHRVCDHCYMQLGSQGGIATTSHRQNVASASVPNTPSPHLTPHHMRRSLSSQSLMTECPVCGRNLREFGSTSEQEAHVKDCLEGRNEGLPSVPVRYVVYKLTPDSPLIGRECPICFEEFEAMATIARLNCLCSYHLHCIHDWFAKGKECPVHHR